MALGDVWKASLVELSGGQRSLVALSLVLALLRFKPAPLYILDEVDAALDLSHTQNIGAMIRTHFTQSQFVVVSLKEGMFNHANVVFRTKFVDGAARAWGPPWPALRLTCGDAPPLPPCRRVHRHAHRLRPGGGTGDPPIQGKEAGRRSRHAPTPRRRRGTHLMVKAAKCRPRPGASPGVRKMQNLVAPPQRPPPSAAPFPRAANSLTP